MAGIIAESYAQALFEIALEEHQLDAYRRILDDITALFETETQLQELFAHPRISRSEKKALIDQLFAQDCDQLFVNFLHILCDRSRIRKLAEIKEAYDQLYRQEKGIQKVIVTSAYALKEHERIQLKETLQSQLNRQIELQEQIDPALLAGMKVQINDTIIDNSARMRLENMKKELKQVR